MQWPRNSSFPRRWTRTGFACGLGVLGMAWTASGAGAIEQVVDAFAYPDAAAARRAWRASDAAAAVQVVTEPGHGPAMKIPLPFASRDVDRVYVDRKMPLDLTTWSEVLLDFFAPTNCPSTRANVYFHSGEGWYARSFDLRPGWHTVRLRKADFTPEGRPAGWDRVDIIRLSPWKEQSTDGYCLVDRLRLRASRIVVVSPRTPPGNFTRTATRLLEAAGLAPGVIPQSALPRDGLRHAALALLPHNPQWQDAELAALKQFVARGGKLFVFYQLPAALGGLLGVRVTGWRREKHPGEFARMVFTAPRLAGLPANVRQASWNLTLARPAAPRARIIGRWFDDAGRDTGHAAVILSDTGLFMSHVLLADDAPAKQQMLRAWAGHFLPDLWPELARQALANIGRIGPAADLAALSAFVTQKQNACPAGGRALAALREARALAARARTLLEQGRPAEAFAVAGRARQRAAWAYDFCHRSRPREFRALWNHSGTGAHPGDWERSMRELKAAGFNAIVPNMWWAGRAHYDSALLPHSKTFQQYGDQIAQCVAAAKKYGIEVHPWKVNWNLSGAPESFVAKLRAEGRLQRDPQGREILWLCPSNPKNFELERATMIEVARNYDVDGIHFDYIRYPGREGCYCDGCRRRFEAQLGRPVAHWPADVRDGPLRAAYTDFRCAQISRLVEATAKAVRRIKPHCKISAAVFNSYPACRDSVGQDWVLWCRKGWLDFVCPMNYIRDDAAFARRVREQVALVNGAVPLYSGLGVLLRWTKTPEEVIRQIELARAAGAAGVILFNYSDRLPADLFPKLAAGVFSRPATLPRPPDGASDRPDPTPPLSREKRR